MKTALQLYSVRDTLLSDLPGHLFKIREMGYEGAEFVNFGGDSVELIAQAMKNAGLEVFSIHTDIDEVIRCDEAQISRYTGLGCRFMPIGWLPEERIAGGIRYRETLEAIARFSECCKQYGIRLLYHNHDFDLEETESGRKLDRLYADTDPEVLGAELDTCWIYSAGADPSAYVRTYGSRCPVLHLKDCVKEGGRSGFRALGDGVLDFAPILAAAKEAEIEWLCVEQDTPTPGKTAMECAGESIRCLCAMLGS